MARILGWSLPTLNRWMIRYGDRFPVLRERLKGREYQFDAAAVAAFVAAVKAEQSEQQAERAQLVVQLMLPGLGPTAPGGIADDYRLLAWLSAALEDVRDRTTASLRGQCMAVGVPEEAALAIEAECSDVWDRCLSDLAIRIGPPEGAPSAHPNQFHASSTSFPPVNGIVME